MIKGLPVEWGTCSRTVALDSWPLSLACWKDTIAIGLGTGDITILDRITGSQAAILSGHTDYVRSVVFSSDGTLLVSGSDDNTVKLWDVQTGGIIKAFCGHSNYILSVSISVDCTTIASGSSDQTICLWDIQTGECNHTIKQQEEVFCVRFFPTNSQHLIFVSGRKVRQWNTIDHQINSTYDGSHVALSPDGTQFVLCHEAAVVVQNSNSGAVVANFHVPSNNTNYCCFSPDGSLIAAAAHNIVYVWDITSLDPHIVQTFIGHTEEITSLTFSSPSSLISSSWDRSVKFWQIDASPVDPVVNLSLISLNSTPIKSITLQVKDGIAISSDKDGIVRTWDILTGFCKASFQTPAKDCDWCDVRLIDSKLISAWKKDEQIDIWDVEKGELLQMVTLSIIDVEDVRISEDGTKVFCLHYKSIQSWSIQTGEVVSEVELESSIPRRSLTVDGSRVWVHSPVLEPQGWDFGIPDSPPVQLPTIPSSHSTGTKLWDAYKFGIKDTVTGKVVFQLGGRFAEPIDSQWDGQYLVAGYQSGEVLILDFNNMASK